MVPEKLHLAFTSAGGHALREAVLLQRPKERVLILEDDLSVGPIDPPDFARRIAWAEAALGDDEWNEPLPDCTRFWQRALAFDGPRVLWVSRRHAREHAGFLEMLWRLGDAPLEIVDLTDAMITRRDAAGQRSPPSPALCLADLDADAIRDNRLASLARPLGPEERAAARALWQRLRAENAALRIVAPDLSLVSAPLDAFDEILLAQVSPRWMKEAYIVGKALMAIEERGSLPPGDHLLAARLGALAASGRIEARGNPLMMRYCELRRAGSREDD